MEYVSSEACIRCKVGVGGTLEADMVASFLWYVTSDRESSGGFCYRLCRFPLQRLREVTS